MLKGSRDAVLHRMQPVSIHGQLFYDLHYRFVDEPDSQMRVARVAAKRSRQHSRKAIASALISWSAWSRPFTAPADYGSMTTDRSFRTRIRAISIRE